MKKDFLELINSINREGINELIDWITNHSDFMKAPASSRYHSNYEGGLLEHSMNVYKLFKQKNELYGLGLDDDSVKICALFHDLCKANFYTVDSRNKKVNGEWIKVPFYKVDEKFPVGHGDKSVIILQQFIKLLPEEIIAIRWHMGGYSAPTDYNSISNAWYLYKPGVCLHTADLEATYLFEHVEEI